MLQVGPAHVKPQGPGPRAADVNPHGLGPALEVSWRAGGGQAGWQAAAGDAKTGVLYYMGHCC